MSDMTLISAFIGLPFLAALAQVVWPNPGFEASSKTAIRLGIVLAIVSSILVMIGVAQSGDQTLGARHELSWVQSFAINYEVGIDGLNAPMLMLLAIFFPLLLLAESGSAATNRARIGLYLVQFGSLLGLICSKDLFLMFGFWALSAVPVYFLSSVWGKENGETAGTRYFVVSTISSAFFFLAVVLLYLGAGKTSFSLVELREGLLQNNSFGEVAGVQTNSLAFLFLVLAVALRVPIWPMHGWFPFLTRFSPSGVTAVFCGAIVPCVLYVFMRLAYSLFPVETVSYADTIMAVGAVNMVVGAFALLAQKELRLFATFLALGQVGMFLIGIGTTDAAGLVGFCYQTLPVGLALGALGLFAGMISERTGKTQIIDDGGKQVFGGLARETPLLALFVAGVLISILGFPGTGGFVGQSLIIMGGTAIHPYAVTFVGVGLVTSLAAAFRMYRSFFLGNKNLKGDLDDLRFGEKVFLSPIVITLLALGFYPGPLIELVQPSVKELLALVS